ncbi:MAG TPA: YceI family protein [Candidatus Competibacteraceae bacterium]|nr:YceI family protein [Candidatus Competibacteraceae bacterium]
MNLKLKHTLFAAGLLAVAASPAALAETYQIDPAHSFVEFGVSHIGFGLLKGRFNEVAGRFDYDPAKPEAAKVEVTVQTASLDTNHAERDKHLKSKDFFNVARNPEAKFVSTAFKPNGDKSGVLEGQLTLNGVTKPIQVAVTTLGAGQDPWGGYRQGFAGTAKIKRSEFGISYDLGPAVEEVELQLFIEGVRQK